jgi:hypothetical protein
MVGGGYKGYVTYTPFPFDRDYFVPGHTPGVATPLADAINDSAATTEGLTIGNSSGDAVKCSSAPPVPVTVEEATIGSEVPTDSSHSTTGTMDTTDTADSVDTAATPSSLTFRTVSSTAASGGSAPVPEVGKVTPSPQREREEMDFNIISLRTSGY